MRLLQHELRATSEEVGVETATKSSIGGEEHDPDRVDGPLNQKRMKLGASATTDRRG
jgi:hypothetical protein